MKKLLGVLIVAATLVSSTFAVGLSLGGRGLMGGRLDTVQNLKTNKGEGLSYGGGAYVNLELFAGLGAQAEANFVANKLPSGNTITLIDLPIMGWYSLNLFDLFEIGLGVGPNFSNTFTDFSTLISDPPTKKNVEGVSTWNTGIAVGANFKIHFGKHWGLVLGANAVFDLTTNEIFKALGSQDVKNQLFGNSQDGKRKEIYGTIGVDIRLF